MWGGAMDGRGRSSITRARYVNSVSLLRMMHYISYLLLELSLYRFTFAHMFYTRAREQYHPQQRHCYLFI